MKTKSEKERLQVYRQKVEKGRDQREQYSTTMKYIESRKTHSLAVSLEASCPQ